MVLDEDIQDQAGGSQQLGQMIDLRENFFADLKIERYSIKTQIKLKMILDFITEEVLPIKFMNTPLFWFDGSKMQVAHWLSQDLLAKKSKLLNNVS